LNHNPLPAHCRDLLPKALFKRDCADFQVAEDLGFAPSGEGEHLWLKIRKSGCNTKDVVAALAGVFSVPEKDIGYSGLKDKHAVTTQWISIPFSLSRDMPESLELSQSLVGLEVVDMTRSGKKLRRGCHRRNCFNIRLRDISTDHSGIENRLTVVAADGFPNYFGTQRFGTDNRNIENARIMFTGRRKLSRFKRSMYLSAARSWLFNKVLAKRVDADTWLQVLPGEVCMLAGTNSVFKSEFSDAEIQRRHDEFDIHTTGPLHGRGESMAGDVVLALEHSCLQGEEVLCNGLEVAGLKAERRAMRAVASDLKWQWHDTTTLDISFSLQRGVYATSLLREVVEVQQPESTF